MGSQPFLVLRRRDVTVVNLIGPFFLGLVINYFLWGIQVAQSYYYYKSFRLKDRLSLKAAVVLLFLTDIVESVCVSAAAWRFMVDGWGDMQGVSIAPGWGLYSIPITDAFTASIVHFFYAQKIFVLLDEPYNYICTAMVLSFSCLQLIGGVGCSALLYSTNLPFAEFGRLKTWSCVWLVTAAATDIIITTIMTLKLASSRTGFQQTDDIISKLIRLTVETGLATAIVQIVEIILYLNWLDQSFHVVLGSMVPKVYSNSMLALLNSRDPGRTAHQRGKRFESIQFRSSQTVTNTTTTGYGYGYGYGYDPDDKDKDKDKERGEHKEREREDGARGSKQIEQPVDPLGTGMGTGVEQAVDPSRMEQAVDPLAGAGAASSHYQPSSGAPRIEQPVDPLAGAGSSSSSHRHQHHHHQASGGS